MAIKTFSQVQNTLRNYDTKNWSSNIELGKHFDVKDSSGATGFDNRSFGQFLSDSISKVNEMQVNADVAVQKLASGESKNLHETLLAVEKAELAFKTMNQIRSKVIDAYQEIMKMQV